MLDTLALAARGDGSSRPITTQRIVPLCPRIYETVHLPRWRPVAGPLCCGQAVASNTVAGRRGHPETPPRRTAAESTPGRLGAVVVVAVVVHQVRGLSSQSPREGRPLAGVAVAVSMPPAARGKALNTRGATPGRTGPGAAPGRVSLTMCSAELHFCQAGPQIVTVAERRYRAELGHLPGFESSRRRRRRSRRDHHPPAVVAVVAEQHPVNAPQGPGSPSSQSRLSNTLERDASPAVAVVVSAEGRDRRRRRAPQPLAGVRGAASGSTGG